jgi:hypothetical protein
MVAWVRAVRKDTSAIPQAKLTAFMCFQDFIPECKKSGNLEECLKKEGGLAIAQMLAGENARQELQ